jgi:DNA-binding transcriptional LysR family regulator
MSSPAQLTSLVEGTLDVGFLRLPIPFAQLDNLPVIQERLVLAVPESFQFRSKSKLANLRDTPFVLLSRFASATFFDHAISVCHRAGFTPHVVQEASDTFTILNFVRAGFGVSLVQSAAKRMNVPGIRYYELRIPESEWTIGLVWKRNCEKRELINEFVDATRRVSGSGKMLRT